MFAFWWLTALRGLRRGEVRGRRWTEINLDTGCSQGDATEPARLYQVIEGGPRTPWTPSVTLDQATGRVLREPRRGQRGSRPADLPRDSRKDGSTSDTCSRVRTVPIHPAYPPVTFFVAPTGVAGHRPRHDSVPLLSMIWGVLSPRFGGC